MTCEIRGYRESDHTALIAFFRCVFAELGRDFDLKKKDRDLACIPATYQSSGGCFLLAEVNGSVAGTVGLRRLDDSIRELKRFYVLKEHRQQGIGKRLLDAVVKHARGCGGGRIRLDTTCRSQAAVSLFTRRGFVEIPRYNDDPFADLFMELKVDEQASDAPRLIG